MMQQAGTPPTPHHSHCFLPWPSAQDLHFLQIPVILARLHLSTAKGQHLAGRVTAKGLPTLSMPRLLPEVTVYQCLS